ncbi:MAG TPA: SDR family oxidoreductase [Gaiellales bacterium]|nr:SDR family oxidoreductase [Gaiellales bacterium]
MDLGLSDTAAIVGGASSGIGLGIAKALAAEGCAVTALARGQERLEGAAAEIGSGTLALAGDVRDTDFQRRVVDDTVAARGRLDILVNNAGGPPARTFDETPDEAWAAAFEPSMNAGVRMTRLALPHLRASGRGRIVNITSSSVREPIPHLILSNAIRPGVVGWAKTLAQELGPDGITVNTIAPGKIDTPRVRELWGHHPDPAAAERADIERVPAGRLGQPDEIGAAVAFLCSTRAAYISGTVLPVDGGLLRGLW